MSEKSVLLTETLLKQDEILSELLRITVKQREALKEGHLSELQDLMSEMRRTSVRAQAIETKRARLAADLAASIDCGEVVSEIILALPSDESSAMKDAAKKLVSTVENLKVEMLILSRLMDEAKNLNEMLISEWRKMSVNVTGLGTGGFDTRI
jgi:hypothetical protein